LKTQTQRKLTIGTIASVIGILTFATGIVSIPDLLHRLRSKPPAPVPPVALRVSQQFDVLLARLSPRAREAVTDYLQALQAIEEGTGSVEGLWLAVPELQYALILDDYGERTTQLERLSEADFNLLRKTLRGIFLYRFETLHCDPDSLFFLEISRRHGTLTDAKFFEFYRQTYPRPKWPVYQQPQTDLTGCTDYGSGKLVELYELWRSFQINHPADYIVPVKEMLDSIGGELAMGTCACGPRETVEREFQSFINRLPDDPLAVTVTGRLARLRAGSSEVRFNCLSG
jgi:hypothetical protein